MVSKGVVLELCLLIKRMLMSKSGIILQNHPQKFTITRVVIGQDKRILGE